MKLWAVIPVFNRKAETLACLQRLRDLGAEAPGLGVILADDGSTDGTAQAVREAFPETVIVTGKGDWWWTGAMRAGVEEALKRGADAILSLNDDTQIQAGSLERLIRLAQERPGHLVAPLGLSRDGKVIESGYRWVAFKGWTSEHRIKGWDPKGPYLSGALAGACAVIPAAAFAAGSYDPKLPHYHADLEFCVRSGRNGYPALVDPQAALLIGANEKNADLLGKDLSWKRLRWMFSYPGGAYHPAVVFNFYTATHPWGKVAGAFFSAFFLFKLGLQVTLNGLGLRRRA